ncbi:tRNA (guanine-N(7)-)-methyltransferase [Penicillium cinerascens]|uniref:tRNA (guanine-N(7)-)-methyltransferase n=1 Tax=Penicillium cinerascens TaxID=70096 RepID=A0A9W9J6J2_9EURO|nr:tRNA (guanine-N(7)-)-methyltransferase [Penicillium cinerascens]KAJ5190787.1 tRNA (guanine-N(7)-)-methyltransferase [Penicillium cinerascens]
MTTPPPIKRQKREEYRRELAAQQAVGHGDVEVKLPQKRFFRQRAHANPFSDHKLEYPLSPAHMDWSPHYPAFVDNDSSQINLAGARKLTKDVEVVDIGCGFGGLLIGLAPLLPETLMVGMEIRISVLEFVTSRIQALRAQQHRLKAAAASQNSEAALAEVKKAAEEANVGGQQADEAGTMSSIIPGNYENVAGIRSNTMKFLPNFFGHHQLSKIFICFPDPHFKARKHKMRIISESLNAEYAYVLRPGGLLYTITDVEEYHHWVLRHFQYGTDQDGEAERKAGGIKDLWERVPDEELEADPCVRVMKFETEESKKVTRNKGNKYVAVFRRKADPEWA